MQARKEARSLNQEHMTSDGFSVLWWCQGKLVNAKMVVLLLVLMLHSDTARKDSEDDGACDTDDADRADSDAVLRTIMVMVRGKDCRADDGEHPNACRVI